MSTLVTRAFVMNSFPWKDRHRLLHLLTPDLGLITAMVPAAESLKSPLRGVAQLFAYVELTLSSKNSRYTVSEGSVIDSFVAITQDLDRLAAASHAAEVFSDVARNDEPQPEVFELWAYTIYEISTAGDPVFIARMGTLRLMEEIGLAPSFDSCVACRKAMEGPQAFSFREGGLLCREDTRQVREETLIHLSGGATALFRHLMNAPLNRLYRFSASESIRAESAALTDRWVEEKMEKRYNRLALLEQTPGFLTIQRKNKEVVGREEEE